MIAAPDRTWRRIVPGDSGAAVADSRVLTIDGGCPPNRLPNMGGGADAAPRPFSAGKTAGSDGAADRELDEIMKRHILTSAQHHVAPGATWSAKLPGITGQPEITQRDLRHKSREIMDAVENGQAFTVTRDGHRIGELIPLRRRRRFVPRQELAALSRGVPGIDIETFRADQQAAREHEMDSPYER